MSCRHRHFRRPMIFQLNPSQSRTHSHLERVSFRVLPPLTKVEALIIALLQLQIEQGLVFAKWTMDGLIVVSVDAGLWVTSIIDADKPCTRSTRNNLA